MKKNDYIFENTLLIHDDWTLLSEYIESKNSHLYILLDENTYEHCYKLLFQKLPGLQRAEIIEVEAGEENKNLQTCIGIWETLSEQNAGRDSLFINLGGGVICDLGGFVASTYKRGIDFINIPTTLLAMVDASIGGKTGIDFMSFKNQIGSFSTAKKCFIWPEFLKSLPGEELISGYAELLKHALIADENIWKQISNGPLTNSNWYELIPKAIQIKHQIVSEDPFEEGKRKLLNFGHTIGHALESFYLAQEKPIRHGEAVAAGMICEAYLSMEKLDFPKDQFQQVKKSISTIFRKLDFNEENLDALLLFLQQDKKSKAGKNQFSLLNRIGQAEYNIHVEMNSIKNSLLYYFKNV